MALCIFGRMPSANLMSPGTAPSVPSPILPTFPPRKEYYIITVGQHCGVFASWLVFVYNI